VPPKWDCKVCYTFGECRKDIASQALEEYPPSPDIGSFEFQRFPRHDLQQLSETEMLPADVVR
jgi:hypothetical protein